uniref:A-kinase anchoring protein 11 n=1 Tax=Rousettus aegyptiacus TaxID=9407 RepID=A0A7J8DV71_ROUAE|nr:A-kinase anchoring protein 11 [Rousettus aegyptiacus]
MATFQILRNRHTKTRASVRKSFSEDVFQSVRSLLQSEKELCSVSAEDCGKQDGPVSVTEVTFLGFNEETDAAHIQDLAAVSLELPDLLNSLHFCSLNENEIICMKDINKSSAVSNGPVNKSHHSGMLCVMRVSPTLPRLRIDFIFGLLSKYATGIRYTMDTHLHRKRHRKAAGEDGDDTSQSVSSIEDDFVTAFEHLEDEETSKSYNDGANITAPKSQGDAASQKAAAHHLEPHDLRILVSSGRQVLSAKPPTSLINIPGHKEQPVKTSVTTSVSEPWIQRSFYRSSDAPDKGSGTQKTVFSSSPAYSSESECSSPSPVIFLDEEGYQKSLKAKLELPKIPVTKDDIEDSDSEVSEFFDSFDQFDELEQTLETSGPFLEDCVTGKPLQKKGQKHEKSCSAATAMNPQKFKSDRPALPAHVRKPTPRKPESPHLCEAPDSPRPVTASGEDRGLFSPIRSSAFSPLGGSTPVECFCQTNAGGERIHEKHDSVYYTYEDYADSISCEVLGSVLHTQHTDATSNAVSVKKENEAIALKSGSLNQKSKSRTASLMIKDSIQKFAADLVEKSFVGAFKDLQKGVSSCTNALCHLAVRLTTSVFQMAFNELRRQRAFSLQERAIGGLANFLVSEALSNALQDLQYMRKQMLASTAAGFAAGLAEELVFEGVMEVCQLSCPPTPASPPRWPFDSDKDKAVKSYAKDLSESVIQEAFIELSQVDVTFAAKAAVSVSTDNVKCVSAENLVPSTETPTFPPAFNNQAVTATRPAQDCEKEYTVQQALFCTSGIVTSIPMPLAGSALLPYHFSANACQAKSHLSSGDGNLSGGSAEAHVSTKNEEEGACLRNICLSSEHNPGNHSDPKPADDVVEVQSSSKLTSDPVIISNFSAAMVHTIVNETLESVTSFKDTKTAGEHTDCLTRTVKGKTPFHHDQVTLQQSEASRKDMFADQLSKSIIKHSIDKSKSVTLNVDKHVEHKEGLPVPGEASQRSTLEKCPKFPDAQGHLNHCSLSARRDGVPECRGSAAHGFSLGTPPRCTAAAGQRPDLKEAAKDKSVKKNNLSNTTPEPLSFGQESPFPHSQSFSSTVLTCVDGLHVEDKQKIRDGNVMPDTPPSTPLVPSRASSECDIKKLTTKLKGELAKDFAPATPPSTPHNSSGGSLSENEQNAIEKEEFMLKLMRSLSEEVESGDGEGRPEVDVRSEHSGKKAQFAEALATRIVSLATEVAASHLDNSIIQEPLQPSLQSHGFYHRTGGVSGRGCGESVIPAVDQGAGEVPGDTLELSPGPAGVCASESAKAAGGTACAPPAGQACRRCDHRDRHDRGGSSAQHLFRQDARSEPLSDSKLGHICQKPRIFHLDVPHVHVDLDKKTVLAEKIVAEAIERAERELSAASVAAGSGSGQEGVGFAESLTSEIMASAMAGVGRALSRCVSSFVWVLRKNGKVNPASPKEIEDFQSAESLGSQQMNLSVGDDSTGSWSNLSFEDEHQDESSSFHHLSESDGPDDKDEEHEDEIEGLEQDGKTLLITNIDMEPCTVDPQLRVILQWLVASEVEVAQLAFHDSAKKEFVRLSKRLQEKGWKVGDLLQAVLKYYDVTEKTHSEDKCKSLFDWLLENA